MTAKQIRLKEGVMKIEFCGSCMFHFVKPGTFPPINPYSCLADHHCLIHLNGEIPPDCPLEDYVDPLQDSPAPVLAEKDPWKHRSAGMRCRTCMWCARKNADVDVSHEVSKGKEIGRCRRHAPTMNGYPVVFMDDWCGDHKLDENKVL